jgi:glutamate/tyrosine decarboxylase-like PLP-dependent enzyme
MLSRTLESAKQARLVIDQSLDEYSPTEIIIMSLAICGLVHIMLKTYDLVTKPHHRTIKERLLNYSLGQARQLPFFGKRIDTAIRQEAIKALRSFKEQTDQLRSRTETLSHLPDEGIALPELRQRYRAFKGSYAKGKISGGIYTEYSDELRILLEELYGNYALTNPMHAIFTDLKKQEAELLAWCNQLFHGGNGTHSIITAGGTLSIFEACKAYVLHARKHGNTDPEIILPESAHPAFIKAVEILNARVQITPIDSRTGAADVAAIANAITKHTCLIVASGMSYPHGVMDPIEDIGRLCLEHDIHFHVDSCLGGFVTAFADQAGFALPPCDFRVPGVTSISADIHKYGDGPKGSSVVMFKPNPTRLFNPTPTFTALTSAVGSYITPGLPGSRSGVQIVTAHAVMLSLGMSGYIAQTKAILELRAELASRIAQIDGIEIPFQTLLPVVGINTKPGINSLVVAEKMKENGWELNCLLSRDYEPAGFHFCVTASHTTTPGFVDDFADALSTAVAYVKANPQQKPSGIAKAYGVLATGFVPELVQELIGDLYVRIDQSLPHSGIEGFFDATVDNTVTTNNKLKL